MDNFFVDQTVWVALALSWGVYFLIFQVVVMALKSRARANVSKLRQRQKKLEAVWGESLLAPPRDQNLKNL